MFYPEKMAKLIIATPKSKTKKIIDTLYRLGAFHIKDYSSDKKYLKIGNPDENFDKLAETILDIKSLKSQLKIKSSKNKLLPIDIDESIDEIIKLRENVTSTTEKIKNIESDIKDLEEDKKNMKFLNDLRIKDLESVSEYKNFEIKFGYTEDSHKLKKILEDYVVITNNSKKSPMIIFYDKKERKQVEALIEKKFKPINIKVKGKGVVFKTLTSLMEKEKNLIEEKKTLENNLYNIKKDKKDYICNVEKILTKEFEKAEAPLKFAVSDNSTVIEGWVPQKNLDIIYEDIKNLSDKIFIKVDKNVENAPTKISNPKNIGPFELLLKIYSLPKYYEIDPSFLIFITFPMFYGLILGDIGYGIVILLAGFLISKKFKNMKTLVNITNLSALYTIFFGILFIEFFGQELHFLEAYGLPVIHRADSIIKALTYASIIGLIHISLGFLIGFINEHRKHGLKTAIQEKLSWIGIVIGSVLISSSQIGIPFSTGGEMLIVGGAIVGISMIGLVMGHGLIGLIEIPSLIGNVLSYMRLAAVGISSVLIALLVNQIAGNLFAGGLIEIILGTFILIGGHALNITLGVFGGFLHSLRLHYVEFFGKFYEGSGKVFKPFGEKLKER